MMEKQQMERTFGGPIVIGRARKSAPSAWFWQAREAHLWCGLCSRTFPNGTYRLVDGQQLCPYADCDGVVVQDVSDWSSIRREHPNYPVAPWLGIQYPLNAPVLKNAG